MPSLGSFVSGNHLSYSARGDGTERSCGLKRTLSGRTKSKRLCPESLRCQMLTARRSSSHSAQTSPTEGSVETGGTGAETASVTSSKSLQSGSAADVSVIAADIHIAPEPLSNQTAVEIGQFKVQFGNIISHDLLARQAKRSAEYDCMQDKFP
jgi:hypothetical protein